MSKIYTKTGDKGKTGLFGGKRVLKSDLRIDSYGTVDELNSYLGLIATFKLPSLSSEFIHEIQSILFDIGSHLALDPDKNLPVPEIKESSINLLEQKIDSIQATLPPLTNFILPGGSIEGAHCQIARTICRRAERKVVALNESSEANPLIIKYLNRLSDFLFVLGREVVLNQGEKEILWKPQK